MPGGGPRVETWRVRMSTGGATAAQMVTEAKQHVENLTPEEVAGELESRQALLVDIREPDECAQTGVIAGAVRAPRGMLEFYADPSSAYHREVFDPSRRTILYCASGGRSALAALTLQAMGYSRVAHLDGGVKAWTASARPLAQD